MPEHDHPNPEADQAGFSHARKLNDALAGFSQARKLTANEVLADMRKEGDNIRSLDHPAAYPKPEPPTAEQPTDNPDHVRVFAAPPANTDHDDLSQAVLNGTSLPGNVFELGSPDTPTDSPRPDAAPVPRFVDPPEWHRPKPPTSAPDSHRRPRPRVVAQLPASPNDRFPRESIATGVHAQQAEVGPGGTHIIQDREPARDGELAYNPRQTDKLTLVLAKKLETGTWPDDVLNKPDVTLSDQQREAVATAIQEGKITPQVLDQAVSVIERAIDEPQKDGSSPAGKIFEQLNGAPGDQGKHARSIISHLTRGDFELRDTTGVGHLVDLARKYPTPYSLEADLNSFVESIAAGSNSDEKIASYREAAARLTRLVYGKQQEYWEQAKIMMQKNPALPETKKPWWKRK